MSTQNKTLQVEDLKGKSLFIATPAFGGNVCVDYVLSMMRLTSYLNKFEVKFRLAMIANESLITRARNSLVAQFIDEEYSHMIFIDGDEEFNEEDVLKMLFYDKDVLCGAVPFKKIPSRYVIHWKSEQVNAGETAPADDQKIDNHFYELDAGGTGFMMIKREVILKMFEAHPELKYDLGPEAILELGADRSQQPVEVVPPWPTRQKIVKQRGNINDFAYTLFDTILMIGENGERTYLSEDFAFCQRWQDLGGKILLDPEIVVHHIGRYKYLGSNLMPMLKGASGTVEDSPPEQEAPRDDFERADADYLAEKAPLEEDTAKATFDWDLPELD